MHARLANVASHNTIKGVFVTTRTFHGPEHCSLLDATLWIHDTTNAYACSLVQTHATKCNRYAELIITE